MKILITGVAGFIGSNLAKKLLELGHEVIGIDNFSTGQHQFLKNALEHSNFCLHKADLLDLDNLKKIFIGANAVSISNTVDLLPLPRSVPVVIKILSFTT